ncbi:hypothetical protein HMPREF0201_01813 [Cedecea davisae DSM 4568]|uniref:Uncharacterized protein n=1 Tax=Cedecea davisae DSM 4568 TaxID=566551 RepID=S3JXS4_9ENTR|nr:hypothetical protein HMPREF0201_01813 [Cedecea davisae DSM 4568]
MYPSTLSEHPLWLNYMAIPRHSSYLFDNNLVKIVNQPPLTMAKPLY